MSAAGLLMKTKKPTDEQIDDAMGGNLCRCGTYMRIRRAIHRAAEESQILSEAKDPLRDRGSFAAMAAQDQAEEV